MIIPNKIRIGKHYYDVQQCKLIDWSTKLTGQINYGKEILKIRTCRLDIENEATFFHELAHRIIRSLEFNHPQISRFRNDEVFVQEMGLTLRKTFIDLLNNQEK